MMVKQLHANWGLLIVLDLCRLHYQTLLITCLKWDVLEIKNRGEYHDLYVQSDTLLLADVFENFRNKCLEIYELDRIYFVSAPGLGWQACLKKTGVKLELITDYDMLLMIEKGITGGICQATHMLKQIINIWKIKRKTMNHHI